MAQTPERSAQQRPGLVTFAGIIAIMLGGFQLTWALQEFANAAWLANTVYGNYGGYMWIWGIVDVLLALVSFYAGYDILRGGTFGQVYGLVIAGLTAIRWFFMLPVAPVTAIVVILLAAMVLYALLAHADYFSSRVPA